MGTNYLNQQTMETYQTLARHSRQPSTCTKLPRTSNSRLYDRVSNGPTGDKMKYHRMIETVSLTIIIAIIGMLAITAVLDWANDYTQPIVTQSAPMHSGPVTPK